MNDADAPIQVDSSRSHKWSSDSEPQRMNDGSPWGFWATAGFASIVFVVYLLIHAVSIPFVSPLMKWPEQFGLFSSIGTIAIGILCFALIVLITLLRRGITIRDYLALRRPPNYRSLLGWLAFTVGLVAVTDGLTFLLGRDIVPEFFPELYSFSYIVPGFYSEVYYPMMFHPLRLIAFILMTPLYYEFLFRGFLFAGWSRSKLGVTGTILLTSILWASIHLYFGLYHTATVFVFGIFLGLARHRTQSLIVPIAIHCLMNLITTLQAMFMFQH